MARPIWRAAALATAVAATLLAGCGGSGGDAATPAEAAAPSPPPEAPPPATTPVAVTVIDGAIRNARVCLDANANGACDAGEVSGRTDAAGSVTLQVPAGDTSRHPVVAEVGTDAVDADHGPVTVPFVMKAPADQPAVVSPLTTLVQATIENSGVSTRAAAASVQNALGLPASPFQDFTKAQDAQSLTLGAVARMVVVTQQQQTTALSAAVGAKAADGSTTITRADIDALVRRRLLEILPVLAEKLADPSVQTAIASGNATTINTALVPLAQQIVASPSTGLTTATVATLVGIEKQAAAVPAETAATPMAQLTNLSFGSVQNWFRRVLTLSTEQATLDSQGRHRYFDNRSRSNAGVVANWSFGLDPDRQSDFHWNGSAWVQCPVLLESRTTLRDAQGRSSYDYCDGWETGSSRRATVDVGGRRMADVYQEARGAGMTNITIESAATALGDATFPSGAAIAYQTNFPQSTAPTYIPKVSTIVRVFNSAALQNGVAEECNKLTTTTPIGSYTQEPATLEALVAALPGKVCSYQQHTITGANGVTLSSGARNEAWGFASVSVGTLGTASLVASPNQATSFFTTNQYLRVAFGTGTTVKYYSCRQRSWDGSARNCDPIGTGTYTIAELGDARVLTLENQPVQLAALNYERIFVQRGGKVYLGFKNRLAPSNSARFNTAASNALLSRLGIPTVAPDARVALTHASYQGEWLVWPAALGANGYLQSDAAILRFAPTYNGGTSGYSCMETNAGAPTTSFSCTITLDPASGALSLTDAEGTASLSVAFGPGTISGTYTPTGGQPQAIMGRRR